MMAIISCVRGCACIGLMIVATLLVNLNQLLSFLCIRCWNDGLDLRVNNFLVSLLARMVSFFIFGMGNYELTLEGDALPSPTTGKECLLISNHVSYLDFFLLFTVAHESGSAGNLRFVTKNILRYCPLLWGMNFMTFIFVKRDWKQDRDGIVSQIQHLKKRHHDVPTWLAIFPEGSRFTEVQRGRAQEHAKKHDIDGEWRNVLIPRARGTSIIIQAMADRIHYVYSVTLIYEKQPCSLYRIVAGLDTNRITAVLRRVPISNFPTENSEALEIYTKEWLLDEFRKKDCLISKNRHSTAE